MRIKMKKLLLLILLIISIPSSLYGELNLTIEGSVLIIEGAHSITIRREMVNFNVIDNGGEAFRVTDGGGQDFMVRS